MNKKLFIGLCFLLFGFGIILIIGNITGAAIGIKNIRYYSLTGLISIVIGIFLSLEGIVSGFKKRREEERVSNFVHRLNMGRVAQPVFYVFNNNHEPDKKWLRKQLKYTKGFSKRDKKKYDEEALAYYDKPSQNYRFSKGSKPCTYAHELAHHLGNVDLISNDNVTASALNIYMEEEKDSEDPIWETIYSHQPQSRIKNRSNLRPLLPKEKGNWLIEYQGGEKSFAQTGESLGNFAARIEVISRKTGGRSILNKISL